MSLPRLTAAASLYASSHHYPSAGRTGGARGELIPAAATASECVAEGFYGDPADCTKFYRCVDFDGTLTRFDFACGPGTLYHEELITCVHPWQLPPGSPCRVAA